MNKKTYKLTYLDKKGNILHECKIIADNITDLEQQIKIIILTTTINNIHKIKYETL